MVATKLNQKYKCNVAKCQRVFNRPADLKKHQKDHESSHKPKQFKCPFPTCQYVALQKGRVTTHVTAKHNGEKPFKCTDDRKCKFATVYKAALTRHRKKEHGYVGKTKRPKANAHTTASESRSATDSDPESDTEIQIPRGSDDVSFKDNEILPPTLGDIAYQSIDGPSGTPWQHNHLCYPDGTLQTTVYGEDPPVAFDVVEQGGTDTSALAHLYGATSSSDMATDEVQFGLSVGPEPHWEGFNTTFLKIPRGEAITQEQIMSLGLGYTFGW